MMSIVFNRIKRVLSLDREVFAEARDDKDALVSGAVIIIITSMFISIGALLESFLAPGSARYGLGFGLLDVIISPIYGWPVLMYSKNGQCHIAWGYAERIGTGDRKCQGVSYNYH